MMSDEQPQPTLRIANTDRAREWVRGMENRVQLLESAMAKHKRKSNVRIIRLE